MGHVYDMDCELGCRLLKKERDKIEAIKKYTKRYGWVTFSELEEILEGKK